jgi:hypothetical protein
MKIPKTPLKEYQAKLTQEQRSDLLKKMAWCNSCDALDIFCNKNDLGYCRECYEETLNDNKKYDLYCKTTENPLNYYQWIINLHK